MVPITPTGTKSPDEVDGAKEALVVEAAAVAVTITETTQLLKYLFEEKMKDGCISKLIITDTRHQATQYRRIIDTLPVLCADKNHRGIDDMLCNRID